MAFKELEGRKRKLIPASKKVIEENDRKKRKKRVAAYCRVSTDSKEQETSYESQVEYYTELIKNNPEWEYVGTYADPAVSGTSRRGRLEFDHMDSLDRQLYAPYIEAFEQTGNGQRTVIVEDKLVLEKITYISSHYQSIGIYGDDPPIPPMMANGRALTADRMYLFEIIAIENGRYKLLHMERLDLVQMQMPEPRNEYPLYRCLIEQICGG